MKKDIQILLDNPDKTYVDEQFKKLQRMEFNTEGLSTAQKVYVDEAKSFVRDMNLKDKFKNLDWESPTATNLITAWTKMDEYKMLDKIKTEKKKIKEVPPKSVDEEFLETIRVGAEMSDVKGYLKQSFTEMFNDVNKTRIAEQVTKLQRIEFNTEGLVGPQLTDVTTAKNFFRKVNLEDDLKNMDWNSAEANAAVAAFTTMNSYNILETTRTEKKNFKDIPKTPEEDFLETVRCGVEMGNLKDYLKQDFNRLL